MGLPEIYISFETAAVSAVKRSSRGVVALAVTDATKGGAASAVYRSLSEVDESKFTKENYRVLSLCFQAAPSKVAVLRIGSDEADTFTALDTLDFDYLAAPGLTQAKVISYIKAERAKGRGVKAVVANATAPDGVDLIRADITRTFREGYIGSVLNDYDNKLLLVTAINAYFKALEGDVLDKTADNACRVSLSGQRGWLESHGTDTGEMSDAEILRANTGSEVFLEASLTFCDAMEDLTLRIAM